MEAAVLFFGPKTPTTAPPKDLVIHAMDKTTNHHCESSWLFLHPIYPNINNLHIMEYGWKTPTT